MRKVIKCRLLVIGLAFLLAIMGLVVPTPPHSRIDITGMGGQLGMGKAQAADLTPNTVDTSTTSNAIPYPNQRNVVYAASRFWVFYSDGTDYIVKSSLDGNSWSADTVIKSGVTDARYISVWYDSDNMCLAYAPAAKNTALEYCQFSVYDNGTISAQTAWQTVLAADVDLTYSLPSICKDIYGYPVISYTSENASGDRPYVVKANQNDGTWASDNFNVSMTDNTTYSWYTGVVPMDHGDFMAIWARDDYYIYSKVYDYSAATFLGENTTDSAVEFGYGFSAVSADNGTVHLVYEHTDDDIVHTRFIPGAADWSAEANVYVGSSDTKSPVLSRTLDNNLVCYWMGDSATDNIYYASSNNKGDNWAITSWMDETDITDNASITCAYEVSGTDFAGISWLTSSSSPYSVRFAAQDLYDNTSVSITCTPTTVNGAWAYLSGGGIPTQYLRGNQWYTTETGITWGALEFTLSNNGTVPCDVLISSENWTGLGVTWYLSDTAVPAASTIGLKAGIVESTPGYFLVGENTTGRQTLGFAGDDQEYVGYDFSGTSDYTIVVKRSEPYNFLTTNLEPTSSVWWGFKILLPTSAVGNAQMTGVITLTATVHT